MKTRSHIGSPNLGLILLVEIMTLTSLEEVQTYHMTKLANQTQFQIFKKDWLKYWQKISLSISEIYFDKIRFTQYLNKD